MEREDTQAAATAPKGSGLAGWMWALVWVAVGIGLRKVAASLGADHVPEWEAGPLLDAWGPEGFDPAATTRPVGVGRVHALLGSEGSPDIAAAREASLAVQVAALACAALCAAALSGLLDLGGRSLGRGVGWMAALWALHPAFIARGSNVGGESALGAGVCLAVAAFALWKRAGAWAWPLVPLGLWAALWLGGAVAAVGLGAGVLVFLMPIPKARSAVPVVAAVALAVAGVWFLEPPHRPALDTGMAHGLAELVDVTLPPLTEGAGAPLGRAGARYGQAFEAVAGEGPAAAFGGLVDRTLLDAFAPHRLSAGALFGLPAWLLGLLELFARGGLLLFAVAAWTRLRIDTESAWPRGGAVVGLVALALAALVQGVGPHLLASVDLVLLAVAGAGATASRPGGRGTRYLAFTLGGLLFATLAIASLVSEPPSRRWSTDLSRAGTPGADLVRALDALQPGAEAAELLPLVDALLDRRRPDLYHPRLALDLAERAAAASPTAAGVDEALRRARAAVGEP